MHTRKPEVAREQRPAGLAGSLGHLSQEPAVSPLGAANLNANSRLVGLHPDPEPPWGGGPKGANVGVKGG